MRALAKYIEHLNSIHAPLGGKTYNVERLSGDDIQSLTVRLEMDMSPECLHRDGEAPASEVRRNARLYYAAMEDLRAIAVPPVNATN